MFSLEHTRNPAGPLIIFMSTIKGFEEVRKVIISKSQSDLQAIFNIFKALTEITFISIKMSGIIKKMSLPYSCSNHIISEWISVT